MMSPCNVLSTIALVFIASSIFFVIFQKLKGYIAVKLTIKALASASKASFSIVEDEMVCFVTKKGKLEVGRVNSTAGDSIINVTCKFSHDLDVPITDCYSMKVWEICKYRPLVTEMFLESRKK
jgi:hypothetical protein